MWAQTRERAHVLTHIYKYTMCVCVFARLTNSSVCVLLSYIIVHINVITSILYTLEVLGTLGACAFATRLLWCT